MRRTLPRRLPAAGRCGDGLRERRKKAASRHGAGGISGRTGAALVALCLAITVAPSLAAGPLYVNEAGEPLVWTARPVPWSSDRGGLGLLDEAAAHQLVEDGFAVWAAVPGASISFADVGALPVDVTPANVGVYVGVCDDGLSPIVFDADGSITDALFGAGASNAILGFAGPECGSFTPPEITEASAVLNGKFIDGVAGGSNPEVALPTFLGVMVHELGHYVNLDHSQIGLSEAFDGTTTGDDAIATMFPFVVSGSELATLARDDETSLAMLYPADDFRATTATVTGEVRRGDSGAPFQGAFVIARNVDDPRKDAVGYVSGARFVPGSTAPGASTLVGAYELAGLTAGAAYTVEVEPVASFFTGGSSVGPLSPPAVLPGPAELWSGDDEAGTNPPDDPNGPGTPIAVAAGDTVSGIDVVLSVVPPPTNDACADALPITSFPFTTTLATDLATSASDDPTPTCIVGPTPKTTKSVWFRVVSPQAGAVTLATATSDYDTVIVAHTGTCGSLAPVACNDDGPGTLAATLTFPVAEDTPYLVAVTDYASNGGTLVLTATFAATPPAACGDPAPGTCIPGSGAPRTDCATEWLVQPAPPVASTRPGTRNVPSYRVTCTDGDPRCDFDGAIGKNGRCTFHVALCANNTDPRPATRRCVPSAIREYRLLTPNVERPRDAVDAANAGLLLDAVTTLGVPAAPTVVGGRVGFVPSLSAPDRCTSLQRIVVPIGTRILRSRAFTTDKRSDGDQLRLRCLK